MRNEVIGLCKKYHLNFILDIGCGAGGFGVMTLKNDLNYIGVDNSEGMLEQAKINLAEDSPLYNLPATDGGKQKLLRITKRGNCSIRKLLIQGALVIGRYLLAGEHGNDLHKKWYQDLLKGITNLLQQWHRRTKQHALFGLYWLEEKSTKQNGIKLMDKRSNRLWKTPGTTKAHRSRYVDIGSQSADFIIVQAF